jgi:hypothetical protein
MLPDEVKVKVGVDDRWGPYEARIIPGDRSNGWLRPRFDRAATEQIVVRSHELREDPDNPDEWFEWDGDVLLCYSPSDMDIHGVNDAGLPTVMSVPGYEPNRLYADAGGMYTVGDGWVWSLVWESSPDGREFTAGNVTIRILQPTIWRCTDGKFHTGRAPAGAVLHREGRAVVLFKGDPVYAGLLSEPEAFGHGEAFALAEWDVHAAIAANTHGRMTVLVDNPDLTVADGLPIGDAGRRLLQSVMRELITFDQVRVTRSAQHIDFTCQASSGDVVVRVLAASLDSRQVARWLTVRPGLVQE